MGSFLCGAALSWSAPALPRIQVKVEREKTPTEYFDQTFCHQENLCNDECDISGVSQREGSWIGALMPVGAAFSGIAAGWMLGRMGRRWTIAICSVPFLIGTLLFVVAYEVNNKVPLFFGRVLTGLKSFYAKKHRLLLCCNMPAGMHVLNCRFLWWISPSSHTHVCSRSGRATSTWYPCFTLPTYACLWPCLQQWTQHT